MSVKTKSILFRNLLYLHEVITHNNINITAEKNGIKASNLSKIIKDLENITQKQLFLRSNKGVIPTDEALKLSILISELEELFDSISKEIFKPQNKKSLVLYIPDNMEIKNLNMFQQSEIILSKDEQNADVIVSYKKPENTQKLIVVENYIGTDFKQKIWVSAVNSKQAIELARFIIGQIHL